MIKRLLLIGLVFSILGFGQISSYPPIATVSGDSDAGNLLCADAGGNAVICSAVSIYSGTYLRSIYTGQAAINASGSSASYTSFGWTNEYDTGMYRVGADNIGFSIGGTKQVDWAAAAMSWQVQTDAVTAFQFLDADGGFPIFNIDSTNERVGIGTAAPDKDLDLVVGTPEFRLRDRDNGQNFEMTITAGASPRFKFITSGASGGDQLMIGTEHDGPLLFETNSITRMTIAKNAVSAENTGAISAEGGSVMYTNSASVASVDSAPTVLSAGNLFHITGGFAITRINTCDTTNNGRLVTLIFDAALTFTDGDNLNLAGNFVTSADDTIQLICDGTNWYETTRSVN